jgi:predicted transcriptional regulator
MQDVKTHAISLINEMPTDSTIDDIIEELYFKSQVDAGIQDLENGDSFTNEEVMERISKCIIK